MTSIVKCILVVILLYPIHLGAQRNIVDSLQLILQEELPDTARCNTLGDLSFYYAYLQPDSGLLYSQQYRSYSRQLLREEDEAYSYYYEGFCYLQQANLQRAQEQAQIGLDMAIKLQHNGLQQRIYNLLGDIARQSSDYKQALVHLTQSLQLARQRTDSIGISVAGHTLGLVYVELQEKEKAAIYFKISAGIDERLGYLDDASRTYVELAGVYEDERQFQYGQKSLLLAEEAGLPTVQARAYAQFAAYYARQAQYDSSLFYLDRALPLLRNVEPITYYEYILEKTKFLNRAGRFIEAEYNVKSHLDSLQMTGKPRLQAIAFRELAKAEAGLMGHQQLTQLIDSAWQLQEVLFSTDLSNQLAEAEARYNISEKEAALAQRELELANERNTRSKLTILALLTLLLLAGTFLQVRSRLRQRRREAERMAQQERAEAAKLRELDELKSNFFTNISHEFRTPLTLLLGPLRQMQSGAFRGDSQHYFGIMERNGRRLENLINQMLDLARLESGKMELELYSGSLTKFLRIQVLSFESWAVRKDIILETKFPDGPIPAAFDPDKLSKILNNLLSNAFKYTPEEGRVIFSAHLQDTNLHISIEDSGIGIPSDELPHIFDRFTMSRHTMDGTASSGIGLALIKELIELQQGQIKVKSELGEGTLVQLVLPILPVEFANAKKWEEVKSDTVSSASLSKTVPRTGSAADLPIILIVEDNPDLRDYIADQFRTNYRLYLATDGQQGWELATEHIPDLIITDLMMPILPGIELTQRLKADVRTSHIPVIMLTAKAEQRDKLAGLETGADDYLTKPFLAEELTIRASNLIRQRQLLREKFTKDGTIKLQDVSVTSIDELFLTGLVAMIEDHMDDEDLSIETLAQKMNVSRSQLHRKLKALTGKSPSVFLRTIRLHRAKELLEKRAGNVSEVCFAVGYSNLAYFSTTFKQEFGLNPSEI